MLDGPAGIAVDWKSYVYVTGLHSDNAFRITAGGTVFEIIDASGDGLGNVLDGARGIVAGWSSDAYVTGQYSNNVFRVFPWVASLVIDETGDGLGHPLHHPWGVGLDGSGNLYVAGAGSDNAFRITPPGVITQIIDVTGDGGGNPLRSPHDLAANGSGAVCTTGVFSDNAFRITGLPHPGTGYCFGDPGNGTPCPCNNDNDGSLPGAGCANGEFESGARLTGSGVASVSADTLMLRAVNQAPVNFGLFFQANNDLSPGIVFGDGLRCAGGGLIRLEVALAGPWGSSSTTIEIGAKGEVTAGATRYYQSWYRDTVSPPCGSGVNDFNLSNGYKVIWLP